MKYFTMKLLVVSAIVMSLATMPADWAVAAPDCDESVTGSITLGDGGEVTVTNDDGSVTVYGVPDYLNLKDGDNVTITYSVSPCGDFIACSVTINSNPTTTLRSHKHNSMPSWTTVLYLTNETGDISCRCICVDDLKDCHCDCGDGPTDNDD